MPLQFQTSFSPKTSPVQATPHLRKSFGFTVLQVSAMVVILLAVILAGVTFFYRGYLLRTVTEMDADLALARKSFEPEFVAEAARLNSRIEASKELLSRHKSLSPLFDLLEKKTLENVRFDNFSFNLQNGEAIKLAMTGQARSFNAVALQSDIFGEERYFKNPVFSDFSLDDAGVVIFSFKTQIDPKFLEYAETVVSDTSDTSLEGDENTLDVSDTSEEKSF